MSSTLQPSVAILFMSSKAFWPQVAWFFLFSSPMNKMYSVNMIAHSTYIFCKMYLYIFMIWKFLFIRVYVSFYCIIVSLLNRPKYVFSCICFILNCIEYHMVNIHFMSVVLATWKLCHFLSLFGDIVCLLLVIDICFKFFV